VTVPTLEKRCVVGRYVVCAFATGGVFIFGLSLLALIPEKILNTYDRIHQTTPKQLICVVCSISGGACLAAAGMTAVMAIVRQMNRDIPGGARDLISCIIAVFVFWSLGGLNWFQRYIR
jgi:hypothetical protein